VGELRRRDVEQLEIVQDLACPSVDGKGGELPAVGRRGRDPDLVAEHHG
jgi:hypothetical protein